VSGLWQRCGLWRAGRDVAGTGGTKAGSLCRVARRLSSRRMGRLGRTVGRGRVRRGTVRCRRSGGGTSGLRGEGQVDVGSVSLGIGHHRHQVDDVARRHRLVRGLNDAGVDPAPVLIQQGDPNRQGRPRGTADISQAEGYFHGCRAVRGRARNDVLELEPRGIDRQPDSRIGCGRPGSRLDDVDPEQIGGGEQAQGEHGEDRPDGTLDDGLMKASLLNDAGPEHLGQFRRGDRALRGFGHGRLDGKADGPDCRVSDQVERLLALSAPGKSAGRTAHGAAICAHGLVRNEIASGTVGTGQYHGVAGVAPHLPEFARPIMPSNAAAPASSAVRFDSVGLRYGADSPEVLRDVGFTLPTGSFHFLTGASGAGKSSLLRLIYMAAAPSEGAVSVFGQNTTRITPEDRTALRRRMGVVFHDFRLIDHMTAFDNAALPLRVAGQKPKTYTEDVEELLAWVGLGGRIAAYPPALSAGEKQRLAIARAVVGRPWLILADEPTGAVDDGMAVRILRLFVELNRLGATVLIATHDRELVGRSGMPSLHLEAGRLVEVEP